MIRRLYGSLPLLLRHGPLGIRQLIRSAGTMALDNKAAVVAAMQHSHPCRLPVVHGLTRGPKLHRGHVLLAQAVRLLLLSLLGPSPQPSGIMGQAWRRKQLLTCMGQ